MISKWFIITTATGLIAASGATAATLAPWFDSNGFYNKPGVSRERALTDTTVCRAEALRVKTVRATPTPTMTASAFRSDGSYDPVASGVASGIAGIVSAIQDASYAESLIPREFRDCMLSFGYRKFTLDLTARTEASGRDDGGFADLVTAVTPAQGRPYIGDAFANYFDAVLATKAYENGTPDPTPVIEGPAPVPSTTPLPKQFKYGNRFDEPGDIQPVAPGQIATLGDGMAIVVMSVRQSAHVAGDMLVRMQFRRVPQDGDFAGLIANDTHFSASSFAGGRGILDETLKGDITKPRYSTFVIPAGRYVIRTVGTINTCLGTVSFVVRPGEVVYLGDLIKQDAGLPLGSLINPFGNIRKDMDKDKKAHERFAVGDDLEAARAALLADSDAKAKLTRIAYENGYRIPCDGMYIGRVHNPDWPEYGSGQVEAFNDEMAQRVNAAATQK